MRLLSNSQNLHIPFLFFRGSGPLDPPNMIMQTIDTPMYIEMLSKISRFLFTNAHFKTEKNSDIVI